MIITDDVGRIRAALRGLKVALAVDKYDLDVRGYRDRRLKISIIPGPGACPECLIPKKLMAELIRTQLPSDIVTNTIDIKIGDYCT